MITSSWGSEVHVKHNIEENFDLHNKTKTSNNNTKEQDTKHNKDSILVQLRNQMSMFIDIH